MPEITGGEPQTKTIALTDDDMKAVKALSDAGFGQRELSDNAVNALLRQEDRRRADTAGKRYKQWRKAASEMFRGRTKADRERVERANAELREKLLTPGDVHNDATIASMSVQYANDAYIGEQLMPSVLVPKKSDIYFTYPKRERMQFPEDKIGPKGEPGELEESRSEDSYICEGYGYSNSVDASTLANQDAPLNELMEITESILEGLAFRRERRIAAILTNAANFPTGNKATIAAGERWDTSGGGNVLEHLQAADAALWMGRGPTRKLMFSSLDVLHVLSRNPQILQLFVYNGTSPGLATPSMIARLIDADDFLVGRAREDTANEGQTASYSRIWGNVLGLVRVAQSPTIRSAHFGSTMRWNYAGDRQQGSVRDGFLTQQWYDPKAGLSGVYHAKATVAETHKVVASDTGYLISTPIG